MIWFNPPALFQAATQYCLLGGFLYCLFGQYFAYRHYKGTPPPFPIGLSDVVFVTVLCGVSGGLLSPLSVYLYGLALIATLPLWLAGGLRYGTRRECRLRTAALPCSASIRLNPLSSTPASPFAVPCFSALPVWPAFSSAQHLSQDSLPEVAPDPQQADQIETLQEKLTLLES